jgi:two-component system sensor histidine kinase MtrB
MLGGTGLGLAIAVEDARLHGGKLQAWGEPGRGAMFRLTLPRRVGTDYAMAPLPLGPGELRSPAAPAASAAGRPQAPREWMR